MPQVAAPAPLVLAWQPSPPASADARRLLVGDSSSGIAALLATLFPDAELVSTLHETNENLEVRLCICLSVSLSSVCLSVYPARSSSFTDSSLSLLAIIPPLLAFCSYFECPGSSLLMEYRH